MLKLKHHFHLPSFAPASRAPIVLAPAPIDDGDELSQAIASDPIERDDNWTLDERPNTSELESFWSEVSDDLKKDPEWTDFAKN